MIKKIAIYLCFIIFSHAFAYAETIKKITINGNKRINTDTIILFSGLKINDVDQLIRANPEYILLTAWNFHKEIIKYLKNKVKSRFIIPLPSVKIIK